MLKQYNALWEGVFGYVYSMLRMFFLQRGILQKKGKDLSMCVEEFVKRTGDTAIQVYGVSNDLEIDESFGVYLKYKYG